jgi:hypothetical protein
MLSISGARAATRLHFEHTGQNQKTGVVLRTKLYPQRRLSRMGHQNALKRSFSALDIVFSKARFLALLTRGVDLGIWFALGQGAVDRQVGSSLMTI